MLVDSSMVLKVRQRLFAAHEPTDRDLLAYVLMPTEIHVLCRLPAAAGPGAIARAVANLVSRWVRAIDRTRGPVFAGRYHAHAVQGEAELKHEIRMLAWRPVAVGLCRRPTYYKSSSLRTSLGLERAREFDARALLREFGPTVYEARMALRAVVRGRPLPVELREWELSRGLVLAIGNADPSSPLVREVEGDAALLVAAAGADGIDGALCLLERWVGWKLQIHSARLKDHGGRQGAHGRALVAGLAVRVELCPAAFVARFFGRAKATLSEQMAASRERPEDIEIVTTPVANILEDLATLERRARVRSRHQGSIT